MSDAMTGKIDNVIVTAVLTPHDNFDGRSPLPVRFGVGEFIDLSFDAYPPTTAAELGGLRWFIASGGGTLASTAGNDGKGLYRAGDTAGEVTLVLKVVSGPRAGKTQDRTTITVLAPTDAVMEQVPGTHIYHQEGTWSVGFLGNIFLRPTDVSFLYTTFHEGIAFAVASGYLTRIRPQVHPEGIVVTVGGGDAATGSQVNGTDTAAFGPLFRPYAEGDFLWAIPLWYGVRGSQPEGVAVFTTAKQHATADGTGRATIEKKGAGPFSVDAADPTSGYHDPTG
jgi:hypothetical protein